MTSRPTTKLTKRKRDEIESMYRKYDNHLVSVCACPRSLNNNHLSILDDVEFLLLNGTRSELVEQTLRATISYLAQNLLSIKNGEYHEHNVVL